MPDILERGQSVLNRVFTAAISQSVRVIRSSDVLCQDWKVTAGNSRWETLSEGEQSVIGYQEDWIGCPFDLRLGGEQTYPQVGDTIEWDRDGYTLVFEVQPGDGEKAWSHSGRFYNRIRVHTKLIERRPFP